MTDWPDWQVLVASDIANRDGIGWEFYWRGGSHPPQWEVFREDGGPFPIFTAQRGPGAELGDAPILEFTTTAVADLMAACNLTDERGWYAANIASILSLANTSISNWAGQEWAIPNSDTEAGLHWSDPHGFRFCFAWVGLRTASGELWIDAVQDEVSFDLRLIRERSRLRGPGPESDTRHRDDLGFARGEVRRVSVVLETTSAGGDLPGTITEVLIETASGSALLVAADVYSSDEWHLYEDEVVVVPDPAQADQLSWVQDRQPWFDRLPPLA